MLLRALNKKELDRSFSTVHDDNEKPPNFNPDVLAGMLPLRKFKVLETFQEGHDLWNSEYHESFLVVEKDEEVDEIRGGNDDDFYIEVQNNRGKGFVPKNIIKF